MNCFHATKKLVDDRGHVLEKEYMCSPAVVLVTWRDGSGRSSVHEVCYTLK